MSKIRLRIIAYLAVFIATAVCTYIFAVSDITQESAYTTSMTSAGLPMVHMLTRDGTAYNYLHGYTCDMDQKQLRSVITPITTSRELSLVVEQYGCVISEIGYEVRDLKGEELIERTTLSDYQANGGKIHLDIKLKNLLNENEEYMLIVKVGSEKYGTIDYYSRIIVTGTMVLDEQINYAVWFSNCTRSAEDISSIADQLVKDKDADNENLAYVTDHCKITQLGYAGLAPTLTSAIYPNIIEYDGQYASLSLNYTLESEDDERGNCDYNVWEYFRLNRLDASITYVNTYQRFIDQIYNPNRGVAMDGSIYLGICSDPEVEYASSPNGYVSAYVLDGSLWIYNAGKSTITRAFSFEDANSDGIREKYNEHRIKIMSVDNTGDVRFVVYGYMNRGAHEGACGTAAYTYSYSKEQVEELAFVESDLTLEVLEKDAQQLAYLTADGKLYFYRNHTIYYVNCSTRECMLVESNVNPDSMMMYGDALLYQKGDDLYHSEEIYLLYMEEGNTVSIEAGRGEYVRMLGFIDDNIVYGICKQDQVEVSVDGIVRYPMYAIELVDLELNLVKDYRKDGILITDVTFYDTKIALTREKYDEESGQYVATSIDELLSNMKQSNNRVKIETTESELRQLEYVLIPPVSSYFKTNSIRVSKYEFPSDTKIFVSNTTEIEDSTYKVYGSGRLILVTQDLVAAVRAAQDNGGTVCNPEGQLIWSRYKATSYAVNISEMFLHLAETRPQEEPVSSENSEIAGESETNGESEATVKPEEGDELRYSTACAAIDTMFDVAGYDVRIEDYMDAGNTWASRVEAAIGVCYDLRGNTIELSEYFTNCGVPLVVKTGEDTYELLVEYSNQEAVTMDMITGATTRSTLSNLNKKIAANHSVILCIPAKANN